MSFVVSFVVIIICFFIFSQMVWVGLRKQSIKKGIYPFRGKATLFDVKRFIEAGEIPLAIRVYREIFKVNLKEAKKAVEDLENDIKLKKSRG